MATDMALHREPDNHGDLIRPVSDNGLAQILGKDQEKVRLFHRAPK